MVGRPIMYTAKHASHRSFCHITVVPAASLCESYTIHKNSQWKSLSRKLGFQQAVGGDEKIMGGTETNNFEPTFKQFTNCVVPPYVTFLPVTSVDITVCS